MNYKELKKKFEENQDPKRAAQMKRYMRNKFDFYGYQSVARKAVYHQDLLLEK
ncbi:DNA alkylation repair protein, partial [Lactobacillus intestinalis]